MLIIISTIGLHEEYNTKQLVVDLTYESMIVERSMVLLKKVHFLSS